MDPKSQSLYGRRDIEKPNPPSRRNVSCHRARFATDSGEYLLHHGKPPQILEHPPDHDVTHLQRGHHVDGAHPVQPIAKTILTKVRFQTGRTADSLRDALALLSDRGARYDANRYPDNLGRILVRNRRKRMETTLLATPARMADL